jgi:hypothetical protein
MTRGPEHDPHVDTQLAYHIGSTELHIWLKNCGEWLLIPPDLGIGFNYLNGLNVLNGLNPSAFNSESVQHNRITLIKQPLSR